LKLLEEVKQLKLKTTPITFYHFIRYYGLVLNNYELAMNMYNRMINEFKVQPIDVVFRLLMVIGGHNKDTDTVMKYYWEYKNMYGKVTKTTWRIFDKYKIPIPNLSDKQKSTEEKVKTHTPSKKQDTNVITS